jgi:hypothetical protein
LIVSGLTTSPNDQLRIASGEARLILMASKSLTSSTFPPGIDDCGLPIDDCDLGEAGVAPPNSAIVNRQSTIR